LPSTRATSPDEEALDAKSVADPHEAVKADVAAIRSADGLPHGMLCVGMVYDVNTGLVETVVGAE
jgi:hypothetical protein